MCRKPIVLPHVLFPFILFVSLDISSMRLVFSIYMPLHMRTVAVHFCQRASPTAKSQPLRDLTICTHVNSRCLHDG